MNLPVNDATDESPDGEAGATGTVRRSAQDLTTGEAPAGQRPGGSPGAGGSGEAPAPGGSTSAQAPVTRRKLDEIFGDVLPSTTSDERDEGRDPAGRDHDERWYRDNRPPHHG